MREDGVEAASDGPNHQLVGYLQAEGAATEDLDGVVVLTEFDQRRLTPPLRLHVTPTTFTQYLRDTAPDATAVFSGVDPTEAAWRLFLVHLDEVVRTAKVGETELVLDRTGVVARRA